MKTTTKKKLPKRTAAHNKAISDALQKHHRRKKRMAMRNTRVQRTRKAAKTRRK
jgi:hypothetical protein